MGRKISKAAEKGKKYLNEARGFCQQEGLKNESRMIDDMEWPKNWRLPKGGNGSKPYWWFDRAIRGNYILMWERRGSGLPQTKGWKDLPASVETLKDAMHQYLDTPEGREWAKSNKPDWLELPSAEQQPVAPESIMVSLTREQMAQFEKFTKEWGIEPDTLARIWILERLRQLH